MDPPATLVIVTDREGLFRTIDGGASWLSVNFDRDPFVRAERISVVAGPGPTVYALAVLSTRPDGDLNPLFMLRTYTWLDRWRMGLVSILHEE